MIPACLFFNMVKQSSWIHYYLKLKEDLKKIEFLEVSTVNISTEDHHKKSGIGTSYFIWYTLRWALLKYYSLDGQLKVTDENG